MKSYTEKPHYLDKKKSATYVSGDLSFGEHLQDGGDFDDTKIIAALNVHRSTTGRFYNFYYGFGATYGTYKFKEGYENLIVDEEKKSFYTINFKSGINYTYTRPKVDWRFVGLEFTYLNEFGPYQDKLAKLIANNDGGLTIANQKSMFTYQLYSEYVFKTKDGGSFTFGFYIGDLLNYKNTELYSGVTGFSGITFGFTFNKCTLHAVFESGEGDIKSTKIGLTYRL
ncbi:hypothetical protein A9Q86_00705 [Flavobacteriales bacterium 33_180_T64]|nr:hypothetical protein A9Q86_00705 [Flavobacteriales bacterium 33_180_T64]